MHLTRTWYERHLARLYDDGPLRMADLAQLELIAGTYKSREKFATINTPLKPKGMRPT